jgi:hypothetical protein
MQSKRGNSNIIHNVSTMLREINKTICSMWRVSCFTPYCVYVVSSVLTTHMAMREYIVSLPVLFTWVIVVYRQFSNLYMMILHKYNCEWDKKLLHKYNPNWDNILQHKHNCEWDKMILHKHTCEWDMMILHKHNRKWN